MDMIDNIVKESHGAYTHDKVFEMSLDFTYNLTFMYYEKNMYHLRYAAYEKQINEKPK